MIAITIEDFELRLNNKNFLMEKSVIRFKPLAQKSETGKLFDLFFSSSWTATTQYRILNANTLLHTGAYTQLGKT